MNKYHEINYPLNVYAFLTLFQTGNFRELHYGLFEDSDDDFIIAQKRSTDLLFNYLYKTPSKLLEVGVGLGGTHQKLIDKGFDCTGITPDTAEIAIVTEKIKDANLICTRFEDFKLPDKPYDILLFQESAQYIHSHELFTKADQLLTSDGRILIVDAFSRTGEKLHNIEAFISTAERSGFFLVEQKELSTQASPTVDYILKGLSDYRDLLYQELKLSAKQLNELFNALQEYKSNYINGVFAYCLFVFEKKQDNFISVHGSKMKLDGLGIPGGFDLRKDFEPKETQLIQALIKPGDIVVDIGANIGYYTLQFARLAGTKGHIYAFEPESKNYDLLKKHIALNHYHNITLVKKGLFSSSQAGKLFINDHNIGMHRAYPSVFNTERSIDIDLIDLDSFFDDKQKIDFIKIDIEGYEYNAFLGMDRLLKQNKKLKMMTEFSPVSLWESGTDPIDYIDLLIHYGYMFYSIDNELEMVDVKKLKKELRRIAGTINSFLNNKTLSTDKAEAHILKKLDAGGYTRALTENFLIVNPDYFEVDILKKQLNYFKKSALILIENPLENLGGIEKVNQHLVNLLQEYDWKVDVKSHKDLLIDSQLSTIQDNSLRIFFGLSSQLDWKKYDLVVTNNFTAGSVYSTKNTKVFTIVHGVHTAGLDYITKWIPDPVKEFKLGSIHMAEKMTYRDKNQFISVSKQIQSELNKYFALPSKVINNGFDFNLFYSRESDFRKRYGIAPDVMIALYAGRWSLLEKRPDITLKLSKLFPDIIWIFAINMPLPESEKFENILVIQNIPYEEMPSLYAAADFTIQLSLYEGFSNFAMESIASKTPMISTRTGIIDEIYSGTELEELLIEQSFDRAVILKRTAQKVQLLLDRYQNYRKYSEMLWPDVQEKFSLSKWKTDMAEALGLEK